jgi:hypothetical protein
MERQPEEGSRANSSTNPQSGLSLHPSPEGWTGRLQTRRSKLIAFGTLALLSVFVLGAIGDAVSRKSPALREPEVVFASVIVTEPLKPPAIVAPDQLSPPSLPVAQAQAVASPATAATPSRLLSGASPTSGDARPATARATTESESGFSSRRTLGSFLPTSTPASATTPEAAGTNCSPAYPTVCIPPPPPDLDCKDVPFKSFTVVQPDPHNLDWDRDGVGCES